MMQEEWRDIPGFPNYQISNSGRIFSKPRPRAKCGFLKACPNAKRGGYLNVTLHRGGHGHRFPVHQIVAQVFLGQRPEGPDGAEIRHLDGDVTNNAADNLVYGSRRANQLDKQRHGRDPNANKTHCPRGREYTDENVYRRPGGQPGRYCKACRPFYYEARRARTAVA